MYTNIAALTAALAATASAFECAGPYFSFYNRGGNAMSYQRLDPALYPGAQSPHLHSFDGGNGLSASMDFEDTQGSSCTTARIKPDKSLYWRPTLFWNGNNTGFYRVPDKFLKIYYKFGDSGNVKAEVSEFPENFRMMAGNPFKRSDDGNNPGGIKWSCMSDSGRIDTVGFPKGFTSCNQGFATEITFPSCWNGKDLDTANPSAHMAWPTAGGLGLDACPSTHKVARFPAIFIEFWYDISAFDGHYSADDTPWVLSNGDPTGFGFHADFLNGWEKGVLAKATADTGYCNCGCGCGNDEMKQCFGADNVNDDQDASFKTCAASPLYGGDDGAVMEKLPGCNPIQSGPAAATQASGAGCAAAAPTSSSKSSSSSATASSSSESASSASASTSGYSTSVQVADASSTSGSAIPTLSMSFPNKGEETPSDGYGYGGSASLTSAVAPDVTTSYPAVTGVPSNSHGLVFSDQLNTTTSTDATPSFSLVTTASPAKPSGSEGCKAPVYITITPTVYVTAGVAENTTSCEPTIYETVTNTATVTVPAGGYKHKRHGHLHKH